jgi:hypothetical protein
MPLAREHDARVVVLYGHRDVRIGLVIAQADVERRPVTADEVLLEMEGLGLVRGDDTSIRSTRSVRFSRPGRESPPRKYERTRERRVFAFPT